MSNLLIACKILCNLEQDGVALSPDKLGVPPGQWAEVFTALALKGYITGISISGNPNEPTVDVSKVSITPSGTQYLRTNQPLVALHQAVESL